MKLELAIRKGIPQREQAFGCYFDGRTSDALGAALEGIGIDPNRTPHLVTTQNLCSHFPELTTADKCPVKSCPKHRQYESVHSVIAHLNDDHKWTREEIAWWVEEAWASLTAY